MSNLIEKQGLERCSKVYNWYVKKQNDKIMDTIILYYTESYNRCLYYRCVIETSYYKPIVVKKSVQDIKNDSTCIMEIQKIFNDVCNEYPLPSLQEEYVRAMFLESYFSRECYAKIVIDKTLFTFSREEWMRFIQISQDYNSLYHNPSSYSFVHTLHSNKE